MTGATSNRSGDLHVEKRVDRDDKCWLRYSLFDWNAVQNQHAGLEW